jgi:hypothetical protein
MSNSWEVHWDGSYTALSETEDWWGDTMLTIEDSTETADALREILSATREIGRESRTLVEQSQRARRLRTTALRLVGASR